MKISKINLVMGAVTSIGVGSANTASVWGIHEPKRPSALKK